MKNPEFHAIEALLAEWGGRVSVHDQSGKEQKLRVVLPDDDHPYAYHFPNKRKDPVRVFRRDFRRALNRERARRGKPAV
jgi:hypothetical protein